MKFERRKTIHIDEFARFLSDSDRKILEEYKSCRIPLPHIKIYLKIRPGPVAILYNLYHN